MKKVVRFFIVFFLLIGGILLYARFISTKGLQVKEYAVGSTTITDAYHGLKIIHISDLHYGSTVFEKQLKTLVEKVNEIKPDIIVFTGDLFTDKKAYDNTIIQTQLGNMQAKLGKFFISGNHDQPIEEYQQIMEQAGFQNIDDTYQLIYNAKEPIVISGISSNYEDSSKIGSKTSALETYLSDLKEDSNRPVYSILLLHEPDYIDKLNLENYNLILSGHSHGGQVRLPFIGKLYTPKGAKKYYDEYYSIENTDVYISSGIGESGVNFRFFNRPSINFYRIIKK